MSGDRGYGRILIEQALPRQLGARTMLTFGADGMACTIDLPLKPCRSEHAGA